MASCRARGFDQHGAHLGCCIWKEFPARYSLGVLHLERISSTVLTWGAAFGKNFLWLHAVQEAWQLLLVPAMSIGSHEKVVSAEMTRKWVTNCASGSHDVCPNPPLEDFRRQQRGSFWPMAALESPHVAGGLQLLFSPLRRFQPVFHFTSLWVATARWYLDGQLKSPHIAKESDGGHSLSLSLSLSLALSLSLSVSLSLSLCTFAYIARWLTFARFLVIPCGTAICCVVSVRVFRTLRACKILPAYHGIFVLT